MISGPLITAEEAISSSDRTVFLDGRAGANAAAGGGMAAARAWWMLRAIGDEPLAVVDGGWQALRDAGAPVEAGASRRRSVGAYPRRLDRWPSVDAAFVERYAGTTEPLDPIAQTFGDAIRCL